MIYDILQCQEICLVLLTPSIFFRHQQTLRQFPCQISTQPTDRHTPTSVDVITVQLCCSTSVEQQGNDKRWRRIILTLILLTWRIWWAANNARKWQKGFNSVFTRLTHKLKDFSTHRPWWSLVTDAHVWASLDPCMFYNLLRHSALSSTRRWGFYRALPRDTINATEIFFPSMFHVTANESKPQRNGGALSSGGLHFKCQLSERYFRAFSNIL